MDACIVGPREFLEQVVEPNICAFDQEFASFRHAYNAVASVDSLAAHIYQWCVVNNRNHISAYPDDSAYRQSLADRNDNFALLRDIAKVHKHVSLTRGTPQVTHVNQVVPRSTGWGEGPYSEGHWGGPPQVVVELESGNIRFVEAIIAGAVAFLKSEMQHLGI